ncbi:MAG: nicotinamide riboside transporter PnuC [Prevotellaceae bacterium]|jgi:nicotinamide mononucleotide transporter|nr:nicotinamide riboside transporter PnuC [Prevotellaceae bacterium]
MQLFDISNIFIKILGYELSYLEFFAVLTGIISVYLASLEKIVNFYIGVINFALYFVFFYQCRLYSMMTLQLIYCMINIYGIYSWTKRSKIQGIVKISTLENKQRIALFVIIFFVSAVWAYFVIHISAKFSQNIEKPAFPYIDALITVASVIAQILLTRKKIDNWAIWIAADFSSVILFCVIGSYFTAVLYACFCLIAIKAFVQWKKKIQHC